MIEVEDSEGFEIDDTRLRRRNFFFSDVRNRRQIDYIERVKSESVCDGVYEEWWNDRDDTRRSLTYYDEVHDKTLSTTASRERVSVVLRETITWTTKSI